MIRLPGPDEVIVCRLSLDLPDEALSQCRAVLSPPEQARGERLRNPLHRRRHRAAWGQLRWLLASCLGRSPERLRFGRERHGKPFLVDAPLDFNLSHSGECLLIAVAEGRPVGVDVERVRPLSRMAALAEHCLAPSELAWWRNLEEAERIGAFFKFWTGKEAFVKADGRGLSLGLKRCVLTPDPLRLVAVPEDCGRPRDWQLLEIEVGDPLQAALCIHGKPVSSVQVVGLPPDWLPPLRQQPVRAS